MKAHRLGSRDVTATLVVAVAAVYYGLFRAGITVPGVGSTRGVAAVVFVLGVAGCAAGADAQTFNRGGGGAAVSLLSVLGGTALVIGVLAIILGADVLLTILVILTGLLWIGATLRHLLARPPAIVGKPPTSQDHRSFTPAGR